MEFRKTTLWAFFVWVFERPFSHALHQRLPGLGILSFHGWLTDFLFQIDSTIVFLRPTDVKF
jgi:hypothetical protein